MILLFHKDGYRQVDIAEALEISQSIVSRVIRGYRPAHLEKPRPGIGKLRNAVTEMRYMDHRTALLRHEDRTGDPIVDEEAELQAFKLVGPSPDPSQRSLGKQKKPLAMPWDEVLALAPDHELVKLISESGDEKSKYLLGVLFRSLPPDEWEESYVPRLLERLEEQLKEFLV